MNSVRTRRRSYEFKYDFQECCSSMALDGMEKIEDDGIKLLHYAKRDRLSLILPGLRGYFSRSQPGSSHSLEVDPSHEDNKSSFLVFVQLACSYEGFSAVRYVSASDAPNGEFGHPAAIEMLPGKRDDGCPRSFPGEQAKQGATRLTRSVGVAGIDPLENCIHRLDKSSERSRNRRSLIVVWLQATAAATFIAQRWEAPTGYNAIHAINAAPSASSPCYNVHELFMLQNSSILPCGLESFDAQARLLRCVIFGACSSLRSSHEPELRPQARPNGQLNLNQARPERLRLPTRAPFPHGDSTQLTKPILFLTRRMSCC